MRDFSLHSLRVISQVLAQTVAMEHYEHKVDSMLDRFRSLNADAEEIGGLRNVRGQGLRRPGGRHPEYPVLDLAGGVPHVRQKSNPRSRPAQPSSFRKGRFLSGGVPSK